MGYFTKYEIKLDPWPSEKPDERVALICSLNLYHSGYDWTDSGDGWVAMGEEAKWYDHEKDLRALSAKMPSVTIALNCIGEDGAHWVVYARDGKSARYTVEPRALPQLNPNDLEG